MAAAGTIKGHGQWQAAVRQWAQHTDGAISFGSGQSGPPLTPRETIVGNWFRKGDIGFISGAGGVGKTWLAMFLARKCAEGGMGGFAEWTVHGARRVLYVDGETSRDETQKRDVALAAGPAPGIFYLHHEALFYRAGKALILTDPAAQAALLKRCLRDRIEILFLDSPPCLFSATRENGAEAWERVVPWLLHLRHNKIAVVFVARSIPNHYVEKTSHLKGMAFWTINLSPTRDASEVHKGASFVAQFLKNQNAMETDCWQLEWDFVKPLNDPKVLVTWKST